MTTSTPGEPDDDQIEQIISSALSTTPLEKERLQRVRARVYEEWRASTLPATSQHPAPRVIRWWIAFSAAAGLAAAFGVTWNVLAPDHAPVIGRVARIVGDGLSASSGVLRSRNLRVGAVIRSGDAVSARGSALVVLARGGNLRIRGNTQLDFLGRSNILLRTGTIYLDLTPTRPGTGEPLRVTTQAGVVEHLGTEFEVSCRHEQILIRVREGRIRWSADTGDLIVASGNELTIGPAGRVTHRPLSTTSRQWDWTLKLAPDYQIEGRRLIDFLRWISRETGRNLVFVDAHARELATRSILHGSAAEPATPQALADVMATTSLFYDIDGAAIRLHSKP